MAAFPLTVSGWRDAQLQGDGLHRLLALAERERANTVPIWISVASEEQIRAQWARLRARGDQARALPLWGVPFAVKDNIDAAGFVTTAACPSFGGLPALEDAPVVARLKSSGAVLLGKTNLDQFATGLVGTRSPYGAVPNAFDPSRVSGGSSSGSAVAVSLGAVPFSLGTDTAGSGRVPAGLNNIVGLKPTRGALSARGVVPACRTLDCVSVFALTLDDASTVLQAAEGYDQQDAFSRARPSGMGRGCHIVPPRAPLRVAVCANPPWFGHAEQEQAYAVSLEKARGLGWRLDAVDFGPLFALAQLLYEGPWVAERYVAIQSFIQTCKPEDMDPVVRSIILRANGFSAADVFTAEYQRQELTRTIETLLQSYDVLLVPTSPTFPTREDMVREPVEENSRLGTYTNFVNFLDWSALAVPSGFRSDGLPFGVTLIGRQWQDYGLLRLARCWLGDAPRRLGATDQTIAEPQLLPATEISGGRPLGHPEPVSDLVVVGAHLSGLPLNQDLVRCGGTLRSAARTSASYRLFALDSKGAVQKPGLKRVCSPEEHGRPIDVEVWILPTSQLGSLLATIPHPLGLGTVELEDGSWSLGFICEPAGLAPATEITDFGGWKAYLAHSVAKRPPRTMRRVLVANRGEIAVRIIRTLHSMGLEAVAIYAAADATAPHVRMADVALSLGAGTVADTYLNAGHILGLARSVSADAVIPGYGFLAENVGFAAAVEAAGMTWIGPTPEQMRQLGLKHAARALARAAGVPVLPGSDGLLTSADEACATASRIGYPIMLKSTAGGGGIGLVRCDTEAALLAAFESVQRLAEANFSEGGVFLEHFVSHAKHVEVQVIGDGTGEVVVVGDRDCSVQRRHQKLIEEAPAPFLPPAVRAAMRKAAADLVSSVCYRNVGTVEFIYDVATRSFYFLEVNTRLQVEHPVTECVTGLDLVECMVRVARGESGLVFAGAHDSSIPVAGASVEVRLYAESPLQQFRPCSGRILDLALPADVRVETWVERGTDISSAYDPLLAKIIATGQDRDGAIRSLSEALSHTAVVGIETNLDYLQAVIATDWFKSGDYTTDALDSFHFRPPAVEVLDAGPATTVQDWPGRVGLWHAGIPPSGPMDEYSFRLANRAVGNTPDAPALECTLQGPKLRFHVDAVVAVTGASGPVSLDGRPVAAGQPFCVLSGQLLAVGAAQAGYRFYVAIRGGLALPMVLGSRSTFELGKFGGHNGRKLRAGDVLRVGSFADPARPAAVSVPIPALPVPQRPGSVWDVGVLPGPHGAPDFFTNEGLGSLFRDEWEVNYNSNRLGVRLSGPKPQWARETGGEAGLHPSNVHDAPYSIGSVSFTGDYAIVLTCDGPSLGGFVVFCVVADAEMWKLGQTKPGDRIRFVPMSDEEAIRAHERMAELIEALAPYEAACPEQRPRLQPPQHCPSPIGSIACGDGQNITARPAGDHAVLLEFGASGAFSLFQSLRIFSFIESHKESPIAGVVELTPGVRTLHVYYRMGTRRGEILSALAAHRFSVRRQVPSRVFRLPIAFKDAVCQRAVERYGSTIRPDAPWLPDNTEFLRQLNGLEPGGVEGILASAEFLVLGLGDVFLGSPCAIPLDPRHRLFGTKYSPSRTFTPSGAVGIGGQYLCIYGAESPGGYQLVGRTVEIWDAHKLTFRYGGSAAGTEAAGEDKPWKFRLFDRISFYPTTQEELDTGAALLGVEADAVLDLDLYESWLAGIQDEADAVALSRKRAVASAPFLDRLLQPAARSVGKLPSDTAARDTARDTGEVVRAVIPGRCFKISVRAGDPVKAGDELLWVESNKMEIRFASPVSGRVTGVFVAPGDAVSANDALMAVAES